jgi:hypothetical protein
MHTRFKQAGPFQTAWSFQAKSPLLAPPIVVEHDSEVLIAVGTKDGRLIALDSVGKPQWEYSVSRTLSKVDQLFLDEENSKTVFSMPQLLPGKPEPLIIFGSESGALHAITLGGKRAWEYKTKGPIRSSPLVADINDDGSFETVICSTDRSVYAENSYGHFKQTRQLNHRPHFLNHHVEEA